MLFQPSLPDHFFGSMTSYCVAGTWACSRHYNRKLLLKYALRLHRRSHAQVRRGRETMGVQGKCKLDYPSP